MKSVSKKLTVYLALVALVVAVDLAGASLRPETVSMIKELTLWWLGAQGLVDVALIVKGAHRTQGDLDSPPVVSPLPPEPTPWPTFDDSDSDSSPSS